MAAVPLTGAANDWKEVLYMDAKILQRYQSLRKNMTKEERHLWYDYLKKYPVQFRRQVPFGQYIVDFYCFQAKLVVELDGLQHDMPEGSAYDQQRSAYLEQQGVRVLRFSNADVNCRFRGVCEAIDLTVHSRMAST